MFRAYQIARMFWHWRNGHSCISCRLISIADQTTEEVDECRWRHFVFWCGLCICGDKARYSTAQRNKTLGGSPEQADEAWGPFFHCHNQLLRELRGAYLAPIPKMETSLTKYGLEVRRSDCSSTSTCTIAHLVSIYDPSAPELCYHLET